ncbi:aminopeptidase N [Aliagarivorans marinus]|uniref:aminopeptidase N n=1 Tax=Aliagarivorans marinus TaxID=561965 RepID=UPI00047B5BA4|nr:aminopeptidase N [Aliagarivorans marinus]
MIMQPKAKFRADYQGPAFTIDSVALDFYLDPASTRVTARSLVRRIADGPLCLDGEQLQLLSLKIDGQDYSEFEHNAQGQLELKSVPEQFELEIVTEIAPAENKALEGLYLSGDAYCTQCEAEGFRRITYFLDRPDVLAKYTTTVHAPKANFPFLLSNGNKVDSGEGENGYHWVRWEDPFPKPSYLFALVAGDFDLMEDSFTTRSGREVALQLFVDRGNLDRADHAMLSLKNAMAWDEQRFGLEYDLDIYMIVAVDFFNMGAMENKGLNVFNSKYVLANKATATDSDFLGIEAVIGHEYFHNWTGNRITCRDWFQLSLKEGLTVFRDQEFSSDLGSRAVNRIKNVRILRGHQFAEDAGPMAHPIRPDKVIEMNNFYTLTVYEKGSEVIRMLHTLLGEQAFQKGMQLYVKRHDGQAVTCDDFVAAMQDASGVDLTLFKRWYSQSGTPVVSLSGHYDLANKRYTLELSQRTPVTADQQDKLPLHIPVSIELLSADGESIPLSVDGAEVSPVLHLTEERQSWEFDNVGSKPVVVALQDFSAPVRLESNYSFAELMHIVEHAHNSFARWDAMQSIVVMWMQEAVGVLQAGEQLRIPAELISLVESILQQSMDAAFKAELLTLPSESELADSFDEVDIDAIATARDFLFESLAESLDAQFEQLELECQKHDQQSLNHADMGWRALRGVCLVYLGFSKPGLIVDVYQNSHLMTDKLAALGAANRAKIAERDAMFGDYEQQWQHDGLVMDKWFSLQACQHRDDVLLRVRELMSHPSFSFDNPNRLRSLVGAFCAANPRHFHAKDGSGYAFLGEILTRLNSSNPQVAARLITPLIQTKKLDSARKTLIIKQLKKLLALPDLSKDLFEKVDKALAQLQE